MHTHRLLSLLALTLLGCAEATGSTDPDADAAPRLTLAEDLRVGSRESPDTGFASIGGVDIDRDGNVYAFEQQQVEIRVYDPRGQLLRTIGRRGSGPGEFERFATFGVVGDTVWAVEIGGLGRARLTLFDRQGAVLSTNRVEGVMVRFQSPGSSGWVLPRFMREDGRFIGSLMVTSSRRTTEAWPVSATDTVVPPRVLFTADGTPIDTIGWDQPRIPRPSAPLTWVEVGSTRYLPPRPPAPDPLWITLADGHAIVEMPVPVDGEVAHFTVARIGLAGDTIYHRRFRYRPRRYDAALLDSLVWRSVRRPGGGVPIIDGIPVPRPVPADSMGAFEKIRASIDFPEFQRPVQRASARADGGLWLLREDAGDGLSRWMVLAPDGRLRGELELPSRTNIAWTRGDTAWAVEGDEVDVPWLVRYLIRPSG
jgi:hypothetical protein